MNIWLTRAGQRGEYEQRFIDEKRIYLTWDDLDANLGALSTRDTLLHVLEEHYPNDKPKRLLNWASQIWPFAKEMQPGDLVVVPLKTQPAIYLGEITGGYHFEPQGPNPFYHWRPVKWIGEAIPRTNFGQDLLYSFGAFMTICRIQRNNAEGRLRAMRANGWKPEELAAASLAVAATAVDQGQMETDLEQLARDQIARLIPAKLKGHGLARLVDGILRAQGYTTYLSPEGPDGGIDILAGSGPLGFGEPRLCVQVKSQDTPIESRVLNELKGAMQTVNATEGLLVSWGGFKESITRQTASNFFGVRLWTQKELLEALFATYERLDEDLKAELPLKRVWTVAAQDES